MEKPTEDAGADETYLGDFVTVATCSRADEANLLKGMLEAAGIPAVVADAELVQAYSWLTTAVGGIRVRVPARLVERAKATLAEYESGAFALEGDDAGSAPAGPVPTDKALYGADAAAFWSLWLTPVLGTTLHYRNSRTLGRGSATALGWLVASIGVTLAALCATLSVEWSGRAVAQATAMTSCFTIVWYVLAGYGQSKHVATSFGTRYVKRSLWPPCLTAIAVLVSISHLDVFFA